MSHIDKNTLKKYKKDELINLIYMRDNDNEQLTNCVNEKNKEIENLKHEIISLIKQLDEIKDSREYQLITAIKTYMEPYAKTLDVKDVETKMENALEQHENEYYHKHVLDKSYFV